MSLNIWRIAEAPYHRTAWAFLAEVAAHVHRSQEDIERICAAVGASIVDYKGRKVVDMGKLAGSASWKQLVINADAPQGKLIW